MSILVIVTFFTRKTSRLSITPERSELFHSTKALIVSESRMLCSRGLSKNGRRDRTALILLLLFAFLLLLVEEPSICCY